MIEKIFNYINGVIGYDQQGSKKSTGGGGRGRSKSRRRSVSSIKSKGKHHLDMSHASLIGKREENEDTHVCFRNYKNNFCVFNVNDGHGGKYVSRFLKKAIPAHFKKMDELPSEEEIKQHFAMIHLELKAQGPERSMEIGSTCIIVFLSKTKIRVANLGDCRALLYRGASGFKQLTRDHRPGKAYEKKRIRDLGGGHLLKKEKGDDYRIYASTDGSSGALSVSRSFGDYSNKYLGRVPDVTTSTIKKTDKYITITCDGVPESLPNQQVIDFINQNVGIVGRKKIASALAHHAIAKGSYDNVSVIIIFL